METPNTLPLKTTSWKTTIAGAIAAISLAAQSTTLTAFSEDWWITLAKAVGVFFLGLMSKDFDVSTPAAAVLSAVKTEAASQGLTNSLQKIITAPTLPPSITKL